MTILQGYIKSYQENDFKNINILFNPLYRIKITHIVAIIALVFNGLFLTDNIFSTTIQLLLALIILIHDYDDKYLKSTLTKTISEQVSLSKKLEKKLLELKVSNERLEKSQNIHKNIQDSLKYGSLIQNAILPKNDLLYKYFEDSFTIWKPKDIVGGDIYFVTELKSEDEILVMVIDGVGHGLSGAFVSLLVKSVEQQILVKFANEKNEISPAKIMECFNKLIKSMTKVYNKGDALNVGFDGGILYYNKKTKLCKYSGSKTPLFIVKNKELSIIQSNRKSVGLPSVKYEEKYLEEQFFVQEGTRMYLSTDGLIDQMNSKNSKFTKKRLQDLFINNSEMQCEQQKEILLKEFDKFRDGYLQIDDITVVGLKF
jgi:serine phosphatase RsbU (regulator of sigma subunit)